MYQYYFKETKAPVGYDVDTTKKYFSIAKQSETKTVAFEDVRKKGSVELLKLGERGNVLSGAVFELYSSTPQTASQAVASTMFKDVYYLYGTYVTDGSGTITVGDLPWDDYYFIETEAPEGYVLNLDTNGDPLVYTFTVDERTASATVAIDLGSITNTPDGGGDGGGGGATGVPGGGGAAGGVAGVRRLKGSGIGGVLGVRSKPTSGVLGVRVGPTTGDVANIALWLVLLLASLGVIVAICIQAGKKGKSRK